MGKTKSEKELIRTLYKSVQARKATLENAEKERYITDGNFRASNSHPFVNVKSTSNVTILRDALAELLSGRAAKAEANKLLGLTNDVELHQNVPIADWITDFQTRMAILNRAQTMRKVEADEAELLKMDPTILAKIKLEELTATYGDAPAVTAPEVKA